jgi:DtxR family Mn-dependent transcriptional regulator
MVRRKVSPSKENYLEAIKHITEEGVHARVKDIAACLEVSMPSVTEALKVLAQEGLVKHERYGHIELTAEGYELAVEIDSRHGILYSFFTKVLGVGAMRADKDACIIEHVISAETLNRVGQFVEFIAGSPWKRQLIAEFQGKATDMKIAENKGEDTSRHAK